MSARRNQMKNKTNKENENMRLYLLEDFGDINNENKLSCALKKLLRSDNDLLKLFLAFFDSRLNQCEPSGFDIYREEIFELEESSGQNESLNQKPDFYIKNKDFAIILEIKINDKNTHEKYLEIRPHIEKTRGYKQENILLCFLSVYTIKKEEKKEWICKTWKELIEYLELNIQKGNIDNNIPLKYFLEKLKIDKDLEQKYPISLPSTEKEKRIVDDLLKKTSECLDKLYFKPEKDCGAWWSGLKFDYTVDKKDVELWIGFDFRDRPTFCLAICENRNRKGRDFKGFKDFFKEKYRLNIKYEIIDGRFIRDYYACIEIEKAEDDLGSLLKKIKEPIYLESLSEQIEDAINKAKYDLRRFLNKKKAEK